MEFVKLEEAEFRKFEQKHPYGNLYQMAERARMRRKIGWNAEIWGVKQRDKILAGGIVYSKNGMAMVPMGPVLDWSDINLVEFWLKNFIEKMKESVNTTVEIFPPVLWTVRDVQGQIIREHNQDELFALFERYGMKFEGRTTKIENKANRWVSVKDLSDFANADELRASYKKNVRNKLRKCSKDLIISEAKDKKELEDVAFAISGSNDKNGLKSRDVSYYEYIWDEWGNQVHFHIARRKEDKAIVAARVIFDHPNETISFISGTVQKYRRMNAMTVLQDYLLSSCLERGIKRVNFYGMEGDFSSNNRLLEFKSGFGVKIEEYIGGFRYVIKPAKYNFDRAVSLARRAGGKIKRSGESAIRAIKSRQTKVVHKVESEEDK